MEQVTKQYKRRGSELLGPFSFQLCSGEILGIRGRNGIGKSTLLGILAGNTRVTSGTLFLADEVRDRISYVPQELSLYEELTGYENLRFWGIAGGLQGKAIGTRSQWLLRELGILDKGRDKVSTYSGGMKRRLHLATALMTTPGLLLLDEPTVGADEYSARLIGGMIRHIGGLGCAVVLSSHREGELEAVCDRILALPEPGGRTDRI